ncbi:MAG: FtsX-like permease family protein [Bacteroidetes bacterium]|nr:MAG: FtsX-like permease family protein [Bacteroidota bacterium]
MQFLGESMLLSLAAFLLALLWVQLSLPAFNTMTNKVLALSYLLDLKLVLIYTGLFLLTGLLAGFYPALVLSGFDPARTLYGRQSFMGKNYLSKGLVVLQFVLSIFLIVATLTIFSQFDYLTTYNLGYNDQHVVMVRTPRMDSRKTNLIKEELLRNSAIEKVGTRQGGSWGTLAQADGKEIEFAFDHIDHSYLSVFDIQMAQGRGFSPEFPGDSTESVLINEAFARKTGWTEPLGKKVDFFYNEKVYTVVGVVKDYHFASLEEEIKPQLFIFDPKYPYGELAIKIKPEKSSETLAFIEKTYTSMFPFTPYEYQFKDEINRLQYESEEKWKQIISFSAFLTIFISCIGLFGLATLSAEKRTKEIGIRKVLGAQVSGIVMLLSSDFLKLVGLAALIAFPAAWWAMNRWLENYPYHIEVGLWIFASAALLSLIVSLLTVSVQALRAAVANPVKSLKIE